MRSLLPLVITLALLFQNGANGQSFELKLAHAGGPGSIQEVAAVEFAERFNKALSPGASIRVYGDSVLGNDSDLLARLKTEEVFLAIVAGPMSSVTDEFGIFDMPFLVRGRQHLKLFREALMQRYLQPAAQAKGYRILAIWEFGVRHVTNNVRPIKVPGDLKELRFRVPKAEWRIKMFESYGVKVTPMEIKDIYPSLQSGSLDGLEMPLPVLCSLDIHKQQKYLSLTNHLYSPAFLVISEEQFQKQPEKIRKALLLNAERIQDWVLQRGEELDASWLAQVKQTMAVNEAERISFTLEALPIYHQFISKVPTGKAMIKLIFETDPQPMGK